MRSISCIAGLLGLATTTAFAAQVLGPGSDESDLAPTGKGWGERAYPAPPRVNPSAKAPGQAGKTPSNGIFYHGGPVIVGTVNAYYIWYGNWSGNSASTILESLAASIGGSSYFNINTTYYDGASNHVSNSVHFGGSTNDNYSRGTALSDADIESIVASTNPTDTNAVYFVLTSSDVTATSGFCTQYCGWHTRGTIGGLDIKYSFVGNPDRCPSACEAQTTSPNGNAGADGMASIISHELEEATADPDLNACYDQRGCEKAAMSAVP